MFNILISDKDANNLNRIKYYIDTNFSNFKVKETINSEREFKKFFKLNTFKIDILIIELRFLGIDCIKKLEIFISENPTIKVIVYGTFDDLEYLKTCVKIGALCYITRPVKPSDLKEALQTAIEYFQCLKIFSYEEDIRNFQYIQNFKLIKDKFLSVLIKESVFNEEEIEDNFKYFDIKLESPYTVAIVRIDSFREYILNKSQEEKYKIIFKILKISNENIKDAKAFINLFNEVIIIFGGTQSTEYITNILNEIKISVKENLNINISCGIGRKYKEANKIKTSFLEAFNALRYRCILGYNSVININYVENNNLVTYAYPYEKEKSLVYTAVIGEYNHCIKLLDEIFKEIEDFKSEFENIISQVVVSILLSINRNMVEQGLELEPISKIFKIKEALELKTLEKAKEYLKNGLKMFCEEVLKLRNKKAKEILEKSLKYVEENYKENINYKSLAKTLNFNPKYLQRIFENEKNETISEYITKIRISKAKEIILKTNLTDEKVAIEVGYESAEIFRKVFKKSEGYLVGDFRYINKDLKR